MVNDRTKAAAKTVAQASGKFLLVGALPAIASAYFTYKTAQIEAQVKIAEAQAKMTTKTEAGYEVMVKKIDWLESRLAFLEERPAHDEPPRTTTRRRTTATSRSAAGGILGGIVSGTSHGTVGGLGAAGGAGPPMAKPEPPPPTEQRPEAPLPRTLDDAVKATQK